jgi:hypothetical protein
MSFNIDLEAIDKEVNSTETVNESETETNSETTHTDSRFNINLESIMENEEIRNDEVYTNLASAIVVGKAVNKLLNEREMERLEEVRG